MEMIAGIKNSPAAAAVRGTPSRTPAIHWAGPTSRQPTRKIVTDGPTMAPTSETWCEPPRLMYVPKVVDRPAKRAPSVKETPTSQAK